MRFYKSRSSYTTAPRPSRSADGARYRGRSHYKVAPSARSGQARSGWRDSGELSKAKRGLPVFLAFCVVVGLVLPIFFGQVRRVMAPDGETVVHIQATQKGTAWSGRLAFRLNGAQQWTGSMVPYEVFVRPGVYTLTVTGGGPPDARLLSVAPLGSQLGQAAETITFTAEFATP
ncbi:hypothetical protein SMC3_05255 [Candidatus Cryosericum hinesii]|uniref:Uncharacterized protein n=1 Tax=Candidatus Cryosericum hinesii TaxID=2290915 RepID=A0A398DNY4_9BACT|nr:hypothetical protein [Candidatus Cryosericum hinesii]RIE09143.1 hypothetical protein SMC4_05875 [Candidatus Cryosericum hinesii]RIE12974.1 hypothetical protein SMC3_05255 [Candidatus Cryosericum hinesii]RIE13213.1 hypothetical protein SMC2_05640 [Candidatus Cryosericum hinesii]